ncbi:hypothetical protein JAAARDRAFT_77629 [Jaapia argillacea MUCL 33604]|uniref:HECT-type E3 ubiquitin transferase n=1 Tax=Jaapia argillacea MUCL 33604 TaxID=933084 RepID=A0A067Q7S2_9AGAM|nr:hypothetical protein JAAARDRAFT_77629 [Jaapia argillacea MUCL 33604]
MASKCSPQIEEVRRAGLRDVDESLLPPGATYSDTHHPRYPEGFELECAVHRFRIKADYTTLPSPASEFEPALSRQLESLGPLPPGWGIWYCAEGTPYFWDQNCNIITWIDPRWDQLTTDAEYHDKLLWMWSSPSMQLQEGTCWVQVRRDYFLQDAFSQIMSKSVDELQQRVCIQIDGNAASLKEFLGLVTREIYNPQRQLFTWGEDGVLQITPRPRSSHSVDVLPLFTFFGRCIGLSIFHRQPMEVNFIESYYDYFITDESDYFCGVPMADLNDLRRVEPVLHEYLIDLLDHPIPPVEAITQLENVMVDLPSDLVQFLREHPMHESNKHGTARWIASFFLLMPVLDELAELKAAIDSLVPFLEDFMSIELSALIAGEYDMEDGDEEGPFVE